MRKKCEKKELMKTMCAEIKRRKLIVKIAVKRYQQFKSWRLTWEFITQSKLQLKQSDTECVKEAISDKVKDDKEFVEYPCFFCEKIICDKKEFKDHKLNCHDKLVLIRKVRTFKAPELPQVSYFPHIGFRSVGFPNFPPGDMFPINSYWNKKSL